VLARHDKRSKSGCNGVTAPDIGTTVNDSLKTLLIVAFLIAIVWNLGAGLYYLLNDRGETRRTVRALTWRIGLSVTLILLVVLGIYAGWIKPHGIGG
jgi:succinate dehydrogenase/fumarate reductase cytochrome b subunit